MFNLPHKSLSLVWYWKNVDDQPNWNRFHKAQNTSGLQKDHYGNSTWTKPETIVSGQLTGEWMGTVMWPSGLRIFPGISHLQSRMPCLFWFCVILPCEYFVFGLQRTIFCSPNVRQSGHPSRFHYASLEKSARVSRLNIRLHTTELVRLR